MPIVQLPDRTLITVSGPDAEHLLQNIITTDLDKLAPAEARPGALLTPQGKIMFDFLISRDGPEGFRIDVRRDLAHDFARRLTMYKLRAKAEISVPDQVVVSAAWGNESAGSEFDSTGSDDDSSWVVDRRFNLEPVFRGYAEVIASQDDPPLRRASRATSPPVPEGEDRSQDSRVRAYPLPARSGAEVASPQGETERGISPIATPLEDYLSLRIANAVAESGDDYSISDAFPHDVLLDQNDGVGFTKGCYVGQEVVSRMKHRSTARRRALIVTGEAPLPLPGTELRASGKPIGTLGSVSGTSGLAIVRIDKVKQAMDAGEPILAGAVPVSLAIPSWAAFTFPADTSDADGG